MSSDKNYQGTDVNLEISLEEYGFVARPITVDYADEYFVIYKMDDNQYGSGHIRESELDAIVNGNEWASEEDVNSMLETVGASKEEWMDLPFTSKFSDLVSYWGTENIMGTDYYPNDKNWAFEEIGLESDDDDEFAKGGGVNDDEDKELLDDLRRYIYEHRHTKGITAEIIDKTKKGFKVKQIDEYGWGNEKKKTPRTTTAFYTEKEFSDLFKIKWLKDGYSDGGAVLTRGVFFIVDKDGVPSGYEKGYMEAFSTDNLLRHQDDWDGDVSDYDVVSESLLLKNNYNIEDVNGVVYYDESKKENIVFGDELKEPYSSFYLNQLNKENQFANGGGVNNDEDNLEKLWNGYASAILFAENDSDTEEPLDGNYSISDFDEETVKSSKDLIRKFYFDNKKAIEDSGMDLDTIGNDIWYTRAGHGAGFFDHNLDKDIEDKLTKGAKSLGEYPSVETYDGKISVRGGRVFDDYDKGGKVKNIKDVNLKINFTIEEYKKGKETIKVFFDEFGFIAYIFNGKGDLLKDFSFNGKTKYIFNEEEDYGYYTNEDSFAKGGGVGKSGFAIMQKGSLRTDAYKRVEFFDTIEKALFKMSHVPNFKSLTKEEKLKLIVPYTKGKEFSNGGGVDDEKPYQVYNYETQNIEGYFDNEMEAEEFASKFKNATVYDTRQYAKGGGVGNVSYEKIYEVLKDKIEESTDDLGRTYENSSDFTGEEIEHKFRDGFIPYTNGGYELSWYEYVSTLNSTGYSLPTEKLQAEMQRHVDYSYELAKDNFKDTYPEIVEIVGEDNIDYNSLDEAGFTDEAQELSDWEVEYLSDEDTIRCSIIAYYYEPTNEKGQDGKHTISLQGDINLEAPYHRKGKNDDFTKVIFTFDSMEELNSKMDDGLKQVIAWFKGDKPTGSDDTFARGGKAKPKAPKIVRTQFEEGEYEYAKGGGVDGVLKFTYNKEDFEIKYPNGDEWSNNGMVNFKTGVTGGTWWALRITKHFPPARKNSFSVSINNASELSKSELTKLVSEKIKELNEEFNDYKRGYSYSNGGGVDDADWIEESLIDLQNETGFDDLVVSGVNPPNHYLVMNDNDIMFEVFKTEDDAREFAIEDVKDGLELVPEEFNKEWLMNFAGEEDFFKPFFEGWNENYVNDIENEDSNEYPNRLIEEMVDNGIVSSEEAKEDGFNAEDYKEDLVNLLTKNQIEEGNGGLKHYIDNFGIEDAFQVIVENQLIDINKASKNAVDTDGIAHFLSAYDGKQIELSNGQVAYRVN